MKRNPLEIGLMLGLALCLMLALVKSADAQTCFVPSSSLVSWWSGEGDATDLQDGNNGTLIGGTTFAVGQVGQGYCQLKSNWGDFLPRANNLNEK